MKPEKFVIHYQPCGADCWHIIRTYYPTLTDTRGGDIIPGFEIPVKNLFELK